MVKKKKKKKNKENKIAHPIDKFFGRLFLGKKSILSIS